MGASLYSFEIPDGAASIPANSLEWSVESQRSVAAGFERDYRDKSFSCWRCKAPDVYLAEEQKYDFEVRKVTINQQRILCRVCFSERMRLEKEARECREAWAYNRLDLIDDITFLSRWLVVLETLPRYSGPNDEANVTMIRKRLSQLKK